MDKAVEKAADYVARSGGAVLVEDFWQHLDNLGLKPDHFQKRGLLIKKARLSRVDDRYEDASVVQKREQRKENNNEGETYEMKTGNGDVSVDTPVLKGTFKKVKKFKLWF